jgi:hypothetical protein
MYKKTQKLHWKENAIKNLHIEDSQGNVTVDHKQVLKIWENYIKEQYDGPNRPGTLHNSNLTKKQMLTRQAFIFCKVEKAIKEMRNEKATRNDMSGDILKLLVENGFRLIRQLSTTYMKLHNHSRISVKLPSLPYRSKKLQKVATIAQSATSRTQQML